MHIFGGLAFIKIIFTLFAVFAWSRVLIKFQSKDLNYKELIFWTFIWGTMIVLVFIPGKTNFLAKVIGMERGNDAMFFLGIVALFYATYRLYVKINEQEKEITRLVRALALKNVKKAKSKAQSKNVKSSSKS